MDLIRIKVGNVVTGVLKKDKTVSKLSFLFAYKKCQQQITLQLLSYSMKVSICCDQKCVKYDNVLLVQH